MDAPIAEADAAADLVARFAAHVDIDEPEAKPVAEANATPEESPAVEAGPDDVAAPGVPSGEEDAPINSLSDLAKVFEIEEDEFVGHLLVDGPEGEKVSLRDALDAYRDGPARDSALQAQVEQRVAEKQQELEASVQALAQATSRIIGRLESQRLSPEALNNLKGSDPQGYIRYMDEYQAYEAEARAAIQTLQDAETRRAKADEAAREKYTEEQARILLKQRPTWRDPAVAKEVTVEINSYMREIGYTEQDVAELTDARAIQTVWEAAQYRKAQAKKPETMQKLKGLPTRKQLIATARRDSAPNEAQEKQRQARLAKFRQSGHERDAAALFAELI